MQPLYQPLTTLLMVVVTALIQLGRVNDTASLMAEQLLPSSREGLPNVLLEALACGCVVFSSLNHALADTLRNFPGRRVARLRTLSDVDTVEDWLSM